MTGYKWLHVKLREDLYKWLKITSAEKDISLQELVNTIVERAREEMQETMGGN